jgi:hypothetical protein
MSTQPSVVGEESDFNMLPQIFDCNSHLMMTPLKKPGYEDN